MKKKWLSFLMASILAVSMAGCSSASSASTGTSSVSATVQSSATSSISETVSKTSSAVSSTSEATASVSTVNTTGTAGQLNDLLLEDRAHWMDGNFKFDPDTDTYNLEAWLETYGVRFTPVIPGDASQTVHVKMSGSGIEDSEVDVHNGEKFILNLTENRLSVTRVAPLYL